MSDNTSLGLATKQAANIKSHGPKLAENRQSPRPARDVFAVVVKKTQSSSPSSPSQPSPVRSTGVTG